MSRFIIAAMLASLVTGCAASSSLRRDDGHALDDRTERTERILVQRVKTHSGAEVPFATQR